MNGLTLSSPSVLLLLRLRVQINNSYLSNAGSNITNTAYQCLAPRVGGSNPHPVRYRGPVDQVIILIDGGESNSVHIQM